MDLSQDQPQYAARTVVTTLLVTDLVDSTSLVDRLGDAKAASIFSQQDRLARDLLRTHGGQEIDKTDGFLMLFARPVDGVLYALAYHEGLAKLSEELGTKLQVRTGIHLGELIIHRNASEDVARGAKPVEVEGLAKPMAARIMSLALGGQTLVTRSAFDLARRGVVGSDNAPANAKWMAHGPYVLKGCDEPVEIFEVGVDSAAPLCAPPDSAKARRSVAAGDEETLGWRPASGLPVPQRKGWILTRKLGEGGFGEVWLAEHKRTKGRRVFKFCFNADRLRSLKRELTLFRLLRDALGDREDIARLFEVQLDEPPFFLESEFTPSGSLIDWAQNQGGIDQVPLQTRLDLVSQTARAVAAAHSVGILHKDIKPGNILIYEDEDGQPRPRLADFGIGTLTEKDQFQGRNITMAGFTMELSTDDSSMATTRMYSPPELLAGRPFTVLGDIYALGVFMYQMAVGDLERPLAQGWERDIADRVLREDIAVCIEGDQEQRMGSAQGLAKQLETLPQRRKAKRRRQLTRWGAFASVVLAVLLTVTGGLFLHEQDLRRRAETAERRTTVVKEFILQGIIQYGTPYRARLGVRAGPDVTISEALEFVLEDALVAFENDLEIRADVLQIVGVALKQLGSFEKGEKAVRAALRIREGDFGNETAAVAESLLAVADVLWWQRDYESALLLYERSLTIHRKLFDEYSPQVAESLNNQGACLNSIGRHVEAESMILKALEIRRALLAEGHDGVDPMDVAGSANNLAVCIRSQKDYQGAIERFQTVLELAYQFLGESHVYVARTLHNIAECYDGLEQYEEAARYYHDAVEMKLVVLGEDHSSVAKSQVGLALVRLLQGDPSQAETSCRAALEIQCNASPPMPWRIATTENLLGACLVSQQRFEEAEPLLVGSLPVIQDRWGDHDRQTQVALDRLVDLYEAWGKPQMAAQYRAIRAQDTKP